MLELKRRMNIFRKQEYYKKAIDSINSTQFYSFGIKFNKGFDAINILKRIKTFNNYLDLETELNKLVKYIYDGKRKLVFHEFRQFPYIYHGNDNTSDSCGLSENYTSSDIYLIKFIKEFVVYKNGKYLFFDVDFIIQNTTRMKFEESPINYMPIDEILR